MQLIVLLTVALQESTERCECYSLRAISPFLKFGGSCEKWHESRTRKEMRVRSLTARFAWHSKWRACSQATGVMGNITVWREPSRWGQTRKSSRGNIGVKKKGWDKRTCLQAEKVTGRFANVAFANILSRSAKKWTNVAQIYASFSQPWYKKVRYACIFFDLSVTDQAKVVRELT